MTKTDELFYEYLTELFVDKRCDALIGQTPEQFIAKTQRLFPTMEDLLASFGRASPQLEKMMRANYATIAKAVAEAEKNGGEISLSALGLMPTDSSLH